MNRWLDIALVATIVVASLVYAVYSLGSKRIKDAYSRSATKYLGLRAANWFARSEPGSCSNCSSSSEHSREHSLGHEIKSNRP